MVFSAVPLNADSGCCACFLPLNNVWGLSAGSEVYMPLAVHTACTAKAVPWPRQRLLRQEPAIASSRRFCKQQHVKCSPTHRLSRPCHSGHMCSSVSPRAACYVNTSTQGCTTPEDGLPREQPSELQLENVHCAGNPSLITHALTTRSAFHGDRDCARFASSGHGSAPAPQCLAAPGAPPMARGSAVDSVFRRAYMH